VQRWLYLKALALLPFPAFASLLYSICFVAVCYIPIAILYRKHIFLRI
jgi:predicted acyltransferase